MQHRPTGKRVISRVPESKNGLECAEKSNIASLARSARSAHGTGPEVDGKFLRFDGERFYVRGITYGTFAETEMGMFPSRERVKEDFAAMAAVGINTVRTYVVPPLGS